MGGPVEIEDRDRRARGPRRLEPPWRAAIAVAAVANLAVAVYLTTQPEAVIDRWPWELTRLSVLFLAAMLAAVAAASAWIAASGDRSALPAGFLNLAVAFGGMAIWLGATDADRRGTALVLGAIAIGNAVTFVLTHRSVRADDPADDRGATPGQALPPLVRASFALFALVLVAVGVALVVGAEGVMPWSVGPGTAEIFGWIFVGDACFFAYGLLWPGTDAGRSQLWAFLGYDVMLLAPLAATLSTVSSALRLNLLVYLAILAYSAVLGVWVVAVRPAFRGRRTGSHAAA